MRDQKKFLIYGLYVAICVLIMLWCAGCTPGEIAAAEETNRQWMVPRSWSDSTAPVRCYYYNGDLECVKV